MTTWYKAVFWVNDVRWSEFSATRETGSFLIDAAGRREKKLTQFHRWFPSKAEALADLIRRLERKAATFKMQLDSVERRIQICRETPTE